MDFSTAETLRIGVISDTHGYFHPAIPTAFEGVDCILHAGDLGDAAIFDELDSIAPTFAVYGNIDGSTVRRMLGETVDVRLAGLRFVMTHIAGKPGRWSLGIEDLVRRLRPDVFICGHSHILRIERTEEPVAMLYLNPGAAGRQGLHTVKTCVVLTVDGGRLLNAQVVHLDQLGT